jgi:shikimate dehydrogenase
MTRPYAEVIGDPIAQSKSPEIHGFWLEKLGIDAEYRACHVRPEELADYLRTRNADDNWRGCNVTMPHKQAVMPLLDKLSPAAKRIGAVNTITMEDYSLCGDNTDGPGFLEPIQPLLAGKEHRYALLIGSGGAARAIADALYEAGFSIISYSRNPTKADREIGQYVWDEECLLPLSKLAEPQQLTPSRGDESNPLRLLINTTPLGMTGYPELEVDPGCLFEGTIVYDIVTSPLDTRLLQRARARSLRTIDGLSMLIGQASAAFEKFFGQRAPREYDAELRELLTQ